MVAELAHSPGVGDADGVGDREPGAAGGEQLPADRQRLFLADRSVIGAAPGDAHAADNLDPGRGRVHADRRDLGQRLRHAPVQVPAVEPVGHRDVDDHRRGAGGEGTLQAAAVGHQHPEPGVELRAQAAHQVLRVGHLGDPLRGDERGGFDGRHAGFEEVADELLLDLGGDRVGPVLEAVTGSHIDEADRFVHARVSAP